MAGVKQHKPTVPQFSEINAVHTTECDHAATWTNEPLAAVNNAPTLAGDGVDSSNAQRLAIQVHTLVVGGGTYALTLWGYNDTDGEWTEMWGFSNDDGALYQYEWTGLNYEFGLNDIDIRGYARVYVEASAFTVTSLDLAYKVY